MSFSVAISKTNKQKLETYYAKLLLLKYKLLLKYQKQEPKCRNHLQLL